MTPDPAPDLAPAALTIRPLRADDEAAWRGLWAAYLAFYDTTLPEAVYRSSFDRLISGDPAEPAGLLALPAPGAPPLGLVHYLFHRSTWSVGDTCYLQDLYTAPAARGQGVARALIGAVYAAAAARQATPVYWLTQEFNVTARRLYDQVAVLTPFRVYEHDPAGGLPA
jgi:GNAT superfamily N-acetyltransferase